MGDIGKIGLLLVVAIAVGALSLASVRVPSLHRSWDDDVRVLAGVEFRQDGRVTLTGIRDWRYRGDSVVSRPYFDAVYDPATITRAWLYEQELGLGGLIAHTFLVFEFDGPPAAASRLGLSVETRREQGETYSLLRGMLNSFEVTHIWATERDLVTRRVDHLDYPLTRYPLTVEPDVLADVFVEFLRETAALASSPRWYHTIRTNCTSSLIRYVNQRRPGAIPEHYSSVLTGRADSHLAALGYLDAGRARTIGRAEMDRYPRTGR